MFPSYKSQFQCNNIILLGNDHLTWRGEGGYVFFFFLNILIPNVAEKNILIFGGGKKKSDSEFLSYNLMLKEKCILTRVLSEKKILNERKNHNPAN